MFGIGSHMPFRREFWYAVIEVYGEPYRYQMHSVLRDAEDWAVEAAEDYHGNHDGWEAHWPLTFAIYETEDGPEIARFLVERETVPQFHAAPATLQAMEDVPAAGRED